MLEKKTVSQLLYIRRVAASAKSGSNGGKLLLQTEENERLLLNLAIHLEVGRSKNGALKL